MNRLTSFVVLTLLAACPRTTEAGRDAAPAPKRIREPAQAGRFYPGNDAELRAQVRAFMTSTTRVAKDRVPMVLTPHAGYVYSGSIAAASFAQLERGFKRVVIIAANHSAEADYRGIAVDTATHYRVPGLEVPVAAAARQLLSRPGFVDVPAAHITHIIEVELPFLADLNGAPFEIVPLVVGRISTTEARTFAAELFKLVSPDTRFVFSIDLSHYHPYADAVAKDRRCLDALVRMDTVDVAQCDTDGTQVLLILTELAALQALTPNLVTYANSGDTSGDKSRVVGYGALAFEDRFELNAGEQAALLKLARAAVETRVRDGRDLDVPADIEARFPRLRVARGAFVTLKEKGELRGCIGTLTATEPLARNVVHNAVNAAVHDTRFPPVRAEELAGITVSMSVLDAPRPFSAPSVEAIPARLGVTRPGLIIDFRGRRSTFLPEVWEEVPEPTQFLGHLCRKQGSPDDCWRQPDARLETYGAQHFGEPTR